MNSQQLLEKAVNKLGVSELSRQIKWGKGAIDAAKKGERPVPPYRAAQLAEIIGDDPKAAYLSALKEKAESEGERKLLGELLAISKAAGRVLTLALALYLATFFESKPVFAQGIESGSADNIHYRYFKTVFRGARIVWLWIKAYFPRPDGCVRWKLAFTVG